MAHLHNFHKKENPGLFHTVGQKIKQGAEIMGAVKGIVETGIFLKNTFAPAAAVAAAML